MHTSKTFFRIEMIMLALSHRYCKVIGPYQISFNGEIFEAEKNYFFRPLAYRIRNTVICK